MSSPSSDEHPDLDLKKRRLEIRRRLAHANIAAVVILLLVIGLSLAAVLQAMRAGRNAAAAERSRRTAVRELDRTRQAEAHALLEQARARRRTGAAGQRLESLAAVAKAAALQPSPALRDETLAALALPDLSFMPAWTNVVASSFLQFSPSMRYFAVAEARGEIKVLNTLDRQETLTLPPVNSGVVRVWFSPNERFLAARYRNGSNVVWEIESKSPVKAWGKDCSFTEFCPGSDSVLVADNSGALHCVPLGSGNELWHCQAGINVTLACVAPRGTNFALFLGDGPGVQVRDVRTGELVRELPGRSPLGGLVWSDDGQRLVIGRENGWLEVWNADTWTQTTTWRAHDDTIVEIRFDPLGRWLASVSWDSTIRFWSLADFRLVMTATGYDAHMLARFSPDGRQFACSHGGRFFGFLEVTSSPVLGWLFIPPGNMRGSWSLEASPDGALVAAGYEDGVRVLDSISGTQVAFQPIVDCRSALFTPDGRGLVTCGDSGLAYWPISRTGATHHDSLQLGPPLSLSKRRLVYASMTSDGQWVAAADRVAGCVQVYGLRNPTNHFVLGPHALIQSVALSPNGQWAASGTWGGRGVRIWDMAMRRQVSELPAYESATATFSPDSHLLVTSSRGHTVWECGPWRKVYQCPENDTLLLPCAFSPDGRLLAALKAPHIIELREAATGRVLVGLEAPGSGPIAGLRFMPDSTRLLALEWTRQIQRWDLSRAHKELAKLGLDWNTPAEAQLGVTFGGTNGPQVKDADASMPHVLETDVEPAPGEIVSRHGSWFYTLPLAALAFGVFIGLYVLRYHRRMMDSYEEVESLAAERNRALDAAQAELFHSQKMRALGTLAAGIAHDFNNLLSIIRMGNNFLLRRDTSAEEKAESGLAVERAVEQGKKIVRSMLGYSRDGAEAQESYSVPDLVNEAGLLLNQQFLSGITLTLELNSQLPMVTGRRGRMQQILLNLLVNASEAMNGHGRLRIAARACNSLQGDFVLRPGPAARYIEVVVEDTGPGIDPQIRERVFEPFFSTKPRSATSGTGLGLSLVHSLAEQEKIGINLESTPGCGTTFTLWIPVADAGTETAQAKPGSLLQEVGVSAAGR
jgi:signal transduction histidine kinase/WD40 repeat protein